MSKKISVLLFLLFIINNKIVAQNVPLFQTLGYANMRIAPLYYGKIDTIIIKEFDLDTTNGKTIFVPSTSFDDVIVAVNEKYNMLYYKRFSNKKNRITQETFYTYTNDGNSLKEMNSFQINLDSNKNVFKVNDVRIVYHLNRENKLDTILSYQKINSDTFTLNEKTTYTYRPNGKIAIAYYVEISNKVVHIYDEEDREIITYYDVEQNRLDEKNIFTYDNKNRIVKIETIENNKVRNSTATLYDDKKGTITTIDTFYYRHNELKGDTLRYYKHIYTFNKRKEIIKIQYSSSENLEGEIYAFAYVYDKNKNWIRRDEIENGILTEYITRQFSYKK